MPAAPRLSGRQARAGFRQDGRHVHRLGRRNRERRRPGAQSEAGARLAVRAPFAPECRRGRERGREWLLPHGGGLAARGPAGVRPAGGNAAAHQPGRAGGRDRRSTWSAPCGPMPGSAGILCRDISSIAARVLSWEPAGADYRLEIELPREFARYVIAKGSIAIDGISLTVAELMPESFTRLDHPAHSFAHESPPAFGGMLGQPGVRSAGEIPGDG